MAYGVKEYETLDIELPAMEIGIDVKQSFRKKNENDWISSLLNF